MKLNFKNNFIGYFVFYYGIIGYRLIFNIILSVIVSFLDGVGLAMFIPLLQSVGNEQQSSKATHEMGQLHFLIDAITGIGLTLNLNNVLIILAFIFVIKGCIKFVQLYYLTRLKYFFIKKVRYSLVDHLQDLSFKGFLKLDSGKVRNTFTSEVQRLFQSMNFYFNAVQLSVMLLTYVILAFLANFQFALFVAIGAGLSNLLYRRIYIITKKTALAFSRKGHRFNGLLSEAIHYFKYLKATNYFKKFSFNLKKVIRESEYLNKKMGIYSAITTSAKEPLIILVVIAVIYIQLNFMNAQVTSIILSLLLFYRGLNFLVSVQNNWQNFIQSSGAMQSVSSLYNDIVGMQERPVNKKIESLKNSIQIREINFSYGFNKVLIDIDVIIQRNTTIALVGESGSGKTTLVNIIAGLLKPDSGQILLDNQHIWEHNINDYRNKIGFITQEPVIFNDNIYNNITFWGPKDEQSMALFRNVLEQTSLSKFVEQQPQKELTSLGDNGLLISGGQKQRISIARELYKQPEILILDEATSALDSETEKILQENIEKLHDKYTIIIIAHRLSTVKNADTIYLIENGRISSAGSFSKLIMQSARFKRMVALQEIT